MKIINIKLVITGFLLMWLSSCSNDTLPVYEDVSRVYFAWAIEMDSESLEVKMGYDDPIKQDTIIYIPVQIAGRPSDIDRSITAEVVSSESTALAGTDIEILPSTIVAGKSQGLLIVKIKNSERINETTLRAKIRLTPNEFFHTDLNKDGRLECNISFDAIADMPILWTYEYNGDRYATCLYNYFGEWSRTKELLMYELFGITREFFEYNPATENPVDVLNSRLDRFMAMGWIAKINRYLRDYEREHGEPLKDENGKVIPMKEGYM